MGFGILFFGYLISINTVAYPGFTKIFAYLVMLLALVKLAPYHNDLKRAYHSMIPTAILGFAYFLVECANMLSLFQPADRDLLLRITSLAIAIAELVFLFFLLRGLQALGKETAVPMLEIAAFRNRIFSVIYYLLYIFGQFDYPASMIPFLRYYTLVVLLIGLAVMFLNAKLFYGFYMWICLPGDEEIKRRSSSLPFLDKIYEKMDRMEEARLAKMREENATLRNEKKKKKEKKKKR